MTHRWDKIWVIIGSGSNGFLPVQDEAITWINADLFSIGRIGLQWNLYQNIMIFIEENYFQNVVYKISPNLSQPQYVILWLSGTFSAIILCMHPANERWRYIVMASLIGWPHTQNDPYFLDTKSLNWTILHQLTHWRSRIYFASKFFKLIFWIDIMRTFCENRWVLSHKTLLMTS